MEAMESARVKPGGLVTLHLLTLSERFIMALCTKPPIPLVGDGVRAGENRPVGEGEPPSAGVFSSAAPSNRGGLRGSGDISFETAAGGDVGSFAGGTSAVIPGN